MTKFNNTYSRLPERFYQKVNPAKFEDPKLIKFNDQLATELTLDLEKSSDQELAQVFSGQKFLEGTDPLAQAYAGFQFGHPNPMLGDGRAHLLGEIQGKDIQLKGSGQTKFSRRGDGRSALGPVLREYIVSEAMYVLGVPTTRALAAVTTGENVYRQFGEEPGGIFTRVADSHLRVGTFQYFAFQDDWEGMEILLNYAIERHYPKLSSIKDPAEKSLEFIKALVKKQAKLVAQWMSLGFIHGVMNTDNFSIAGITIDYGPCAFMDEFDHNKVFSSIDHQGRYAYSNQLNIAKWNIFTLADCLLPFIDKDKDKAVEKVKEVILPAMESFEEEKWKALSLKLGLKESHQNLVNLFFDFLHEEKLDFTLSFRHLPSLLKDQTDFFPKSKKLEEFLKMWKEESPDISNLDQINPLYIPRNHLIEKAIQDAYKNDFQLFHQLLEVGQNPFKENKDWELFSIPPLPEERVHQTFCGT